MSILAIDRGWKSDKEIIYGICIELRRLTHSHYLWLLLVKFFLVIARMDTPKYGETLKFVYIKNQMILVKSYQRFTKINYGVTRTNYES